MNKILSIVGPTATGKTSLAIKKADDFIASKEVTGVDLISADSRQVYQGLEIITGADIPKSFSLFSEKNNYKTWINPQKNIFLHGVSIIKPNQEWSLGHFQEFAQNIIKKSWENNRLPIIVGGTGLYHHHLLDLSEQIKIKPNPKVRQKTAKMALPELQNWLKKINKKHFEKMNNSDQNNPRRLVRAIEIALNSKNKVKPLPQNNFSKAEIETIGILDTLENIERKIKRRVEDRFKNGAIEEVKNLYKKYPKLAKSAQSYPAFSSTGVKEIWGFLNQDIDQETCLKKWTLREFQYAKRQLTWWKNKKNITWLERK